MKSSHEEHVAWRGEADDQTPPTIGSLVHAAPPVVTTTCKLAELRAILLQRRVPAVAIVDVTNRLVGIVTRTDLLEAKHTAATAGDIMSGFAFSVPAETSIAKAAALMACEGVGQIVVTGDGCRLVGMVSGIDIARHIAIEAGYLAG